MRVSVEFQDERLDFEVAEDRLVGSFTGPDGISGADRVSAIVGALRRPLDFPPFSALFVPGDRLAIALDAGFPEAGDLLTALLPMAREALGESGAITIVAPPGLGLDVTGDLPEGVRWVIHDPSDRNELAYLASTKEGRRVYLNRHLTDADVVISAGEFRFDPALGARGPWSAVFPELSDESTRGDFKSARTPSAESSVSSLLEESVEASWLLGSQFSVGFLPGRSGFSEVVSGLNTSVRDRGLDALERAWGFRPESQAELVVAGIGRPGDAVGLEALVAGLEAGVKLVQHGGKVVVLSRARGKIGPALRRLMEAGDPRRGAAALRGRENDEDFAIASRLNAALAWADIYLLSGLDPQAVEELSMVPLEKPAEAARLVATARSCTFLSQAELTRVGVADDT